MKKIAQSFKTTQYTQFHKECDIRVIMPTNKREYCITFIDGSEITVIMTSRQRDSFNRRKDNHLVKHIAGLEYVDQRTVWEIGGFTVNLMVRSQMFLVSHFEDAIPVVEVGNWILALKHIDSYYKKLKNDVSVS